MPRYRKLHIKTVESFDFNDMPDDFHRVFWLTLPLQLSSDGTLPADAMLIRSKVFPLRRDVTCDKIEAALAWFAAHDMIRFYEVDGHRYLWAVNFAKYQGVTTKEAASDYPPVPEQVKTNARVSQELVSQESSTDSVFNMQYSDVDADAVCEKSIGDGGNGHATRSKAEKPSVEPMPEYPDTDTEAGEVFRVWQLARGGLCNPLDAERIGHLIDETSPKWVTEAIHEANASRNGGIISLNFVSAILDRWKADGFKAPRDRGAPEKAADDLAHKKQMANEVRSQLRKEQIPEERIQAAILKQFGEGV